MSRLSIEALKKLESGVEDLVEDDNPEEAEDDLGSDIHLIFLSIAISLKRIAVALNRK